MQPQETYTIPLLKKSKAHSLKISLRSFFVISLCYLTAPVIVFFIGYLKIWWALLFSGLTVFALWWAFRELKKDKSGKMDFTLEFKPSYFLVVVPLVFVFVFIGGVGEFSWTLIDHRVRYAILNDLVSYKWPIVYDYSTQQNPAVAEALGEGKAGFAYYFVFWMIPAVAGKLFGLLAARVTLLIWSAAGLLLTAVGSCFIYKKVSRTMFAALMLFSGFDVIPYYINKWLGIGTTWEGWNINLYIHGDFYQIVNVFNQCIPGWLVTVLLLLCVNGRITGLLGSLIFCYSPWAAIGILPMCVCRIVMDQKDKKNIVKDLFTPANIVAPVVFFICFASLFTANNAATSSSGFIWKFYDSPKDLVIDYIKYAVFEFGIWFVIIIRKHRKDAMLWTALVTLLVMPVYKITWVNDFIMRGTMAPMFMIALYSCMFIADNFDTCLHNPKFDLRSRLAVLLIVAAAYVPFNIFVTSAMLTYELRVNKQHLEEDVSHDIESFGNIRQEEFLDMVRTQFYVEDYEDSFFFKYLAK